MNLLKTKITFAVLLSFIILSCSKDEVSVGFEEINAVLATVITNTPTQIGSVSARIGGTLVNTGEQNAYVNTGVYWGLQPNLTATDNSVTINNIGPGNFEGLLESLEPNTTYYVRAFASNSAGTAYGESIAFTTIDFLNFVTDIPKDILAERAYIKTTMTYDEDAGYVSEKGFVLSTVPNPTTDHITVESTQGESEYAIQFFNLNSNTTYYVRPYAKVSYFAGGVSTVYGVDQTFKTTGYFGPAGGYVVYDKGETTDGWRYLEAVPDINLGEARWGCTNTFLSGTYSEIGEGLTNSERIFVNCSDLNDSAALHSLLLDYNGYNDWFLPSTDEAIVTMRSLMDLNDLGSNTMWTSTETNTQEAYYIFRNDGNIITSTRSKGSYAGYRPIRRY